jgi:small subunit ribosomal protein S2
MKVPEIKEMLEAGIHFGHQTLRWNPKMRKYILAEKNGIHIIDLKKTQDCLKLALEKIIQTLKSKKSVLFVGTKKSVKHCIKEEAKRAKMFFVTERWLGGMLTNFTTVRQSIKTLEDIEAALADEKTDLKKKEKVALDKKRKKLEAVLGGIRNMTELPGLVFIADTKSDHITVKETKRLHIPTVAIVDTNSNPDEVSFPIPGNDDAIKSVNLITKNIADIIIEFSGSMAKQESEAEEPISDAGSTTSVSEKSEATDAEVAAVPASSPPVQPKATENVTDAVETPAPANIPEKQQPAPVKKAEPVDTQTKEE